jgi:hypothetical protein
LVGLKRWGGRKDIGDGPYIHGWATEYRDENQEWDMGKTTRTQYVDTGEADKTVMVDSKGKEKAQRSWAWSEKAMYRDIANGFYFSC